MSRNRIWTAVFALLLGGAVQAQESQYTNIEKAVEAASKGGKDILVDFTGSDWCGWCIRLKEEVFDKPEWKTYAEKHIVFVELDFPQKKKLAEGQVAYNNKMKDRFGISGYPTIVLLDSKGAPYAKTGYQRGGPAAYINHVKEFAARKKEIQESLSRAKTGEDVDFLAAFLRKLKTWGVDAGYPELKERIVVLDKDNKGGHRLAWAENLATHYFKSGDAAKGKHYVEIVRKHDAGKADAIEISIKVENEVYPLFRKRDWKGARAILQGLLAKNPKGEAAQNLNYYAGIAEYRLGNKDRAVALFETARKAAPETRLGKQLLQIIERLKKGPGK